MKGFLQTTIAFPWTVQNELDALMAAALGTNQTVTSCAVLDTPTKNGWNAFYSALITFSKQDFGFWSFGNGARLDQIESYNDQLAGWQKLLSQKCTLTVPLVEASNEYTPQILSIAQWGVVAIAAVAGAYVIGDVVSVVTPFLPKDGVKGAAREARRLTRSVRR
jgi:hypothetical protein